MLRGTVTALITPFRDDLSLDVEALRRLVDRQLDSEVAGVLLLGTTGESPTLTSEERERVLRAGLDCAREGKALVAGVGSNSTAHAVELARQAKTLGYRYGLAVSPYYNKPTQAGLFAHYSALAEATSLDLLLYDVPSRTGVSISVETAARLFAAHENVVGIKEASGDVTRIAPLREAMGPDAFMASGVDELNVELVETGANGAVSVVSNLFPNETARCVAAAMAGERDRARAPAERLQPLIEALFLETSPAPVKHAARVMGLIPSAALRLPLVPVTPDTARAVEAAVRGV